MSGRGIWLYTDEDVDVGVARQLQGQGYDILSCRDAGNAGRRLSDEWQLDYATRQRRAILTHNVSDYFKLDAAWRVLGREHWGIICAARGDRLGELVRRTKLHLDTIPTDVQYNAVLYLAR